ncbi:MAG: hypothetical protein ABR536_03535 [Solirubrobacterales bacterium]
MAGALAVAVVLAVPGAAGASVASPIRAVFLKEFSKPSYQMSRGQLLVFENDDPFLIHGLGGALVAARALPGETRLVRNSPYLAPGNYPFNDPFHPEMASVLTVTAGGTPPPPDVAAPAGPVRLLATTARRVAKTGQVRVRVIPSEAVDVDLNLFVGKTKLASGSGTLTDAVPGVLAVSLPPPARKQVHPGTVLSLRAKLIDVTGKLTKKRTARRVGGGGGGKGK